MILAVLLALQLFLMSDGAKQSGGAPAVESFVMRLTAPGVALAHSVAGGFRNGMGGARDLLAAHARNAALEAELHRLESELVRYREAEPENRRLRRLLGMREELAPQSVAASIVTANQNGRNRVIVIDRGSRDGVRVDAPVVAWGGAVGRVTSIAPRNAKVRLLTDASSGVAGVVQRSRAQGIVEGQAGSALHLLYVPRYSDVSHGDRVVTSGLDGVFPRGYGIGHVTAIAETADGGLTIELEPELDYGALEEVLVLTDSSGGTEPELADEPSP